MVGASDVNFPRVVTRVLGVRLCFAKPTAGVGDVNIPKVAARVLRVRLCFAQDMVGVGVVATSLDVAST
jgi:hypothetical protein